MKKENFLDTVTVNDYKSLMENSYMGNSFSLLGFEKAYDAEGIVRVVKLDVFSKQFNKKTSIKLTAYTCSDGLFEPVWVEFVKGKIGEKAMYSSLYKQAKLHNKPAKAPIMAKTDNSEFNI